MSKLEHDMKGKVAIVTGATGGIGKEIARGLARMGATVVIGARTPERGEATKKDIGGDNVSVMIVDVASPASIRSFVSDFEKRFDRLDVLVNNAGVWFTDRREDKDGHELTWATNVLGPYLLTKLLVPRLRAAAPSRVVNIVSSIGSDYDASDVEFKRRKYSGMKCYAQSKQALRMLTWHFAGELEKDRIRVNAAAPGFVRSDFNQNAHGFLATMINLSARIMGVSPAEGADTPIWVASAPELDDTTGEYFEKRKQGDGKFRDPGPIAELVKLCEKMISQPPTKSAEKSATS